jgi:hypothetical protein
VRNTGDGDDEEDDEADVGDNSILISDDSESNSFDKPMERLGELGRNNAERKNL